MSHIFISCDEFVISFWLLLLINNNWVVDGASLIMSHTSHKVLLWALCSWSSWPTTCCTCCLSSSTSWCSATSLCWNSRCSTSTRPSLLRLPRTLRYRFQLLLHRIVISLYLSFLLWCNLWHLLDRLIDDEGLLCLCLCLSQCLLLSIWALGLALHLAFDHILNLVLSS